MAYRISNDTLVDLFNGTGDLKAKRLKAVGNANDRFAEDALRMMRAVRLAAELDFVIESETMAAIINNNKQLSRISIERVSHEFIRTVNSQTQCKELCLWKNLAFWSNFFLN